MTDSRTRLSSSASSKNKTHLCPNPETNGAYAAQEPDTRNPVPEQSDMLPSPRPKVPASVKRPVRGGAQKRNEGSENQPESASLLLSVPLAQTSLAACLRGACPHQIHNRATLARYAGTPGNAPPSPAARPPLRAPRCPTRLRPGRPSHTEPGPALREGGPHPAEGLQGARLRPAGACLCPHCKPYFHLLTPPAAGRRSPALFWVLVCVR